MRLFVAFAFLALITSCTKDKGELVIDYSNCDTSKITYCSPIRDILIINCGTEAGCHATNESQFSVFNYKEVKLQVDNGNFNTRVFVNQDMPPAYSTLSASDSQKIQDWLNAGAPER